MIISERIFDILKKRNISQKTFSEETGISQSTISDWKRKKTNPAADKIMIICDALQITPYQLLCEREEETEYDEDCITIRRGSDEYLLIEKYRRLRKQQRGSIQGYLQALTEK